MRVLLVEDDPTTQQSVRMILESASMVVDTADLGEDGLEISKIYDYDIIILDLMLPDINGLEVIERLLSIAPHLPVIVISASSDMADIREAQRTYEANLNIIEGSRAMINRALDLLRNS